MCSLVVSVRDSPAVGSGSALLMREKSQAVYYISSCHMLIDKALSSDKPNGHWFEADWLHCKRDAKAECGFRTTPEECLYDSGPIGPSV